MHELDQMKSKRVGVIDFFCGCGGTSRGFQLAQDSRHEFEILGGVDFDKSCCDTFEKSIGAPALQIDVADLLDYDDPKTYLLEQFGCDEPDELVVIGCSPCQGFSGHRRSVKGKDGRRNLFLILCQLIEKISPSAVFMENVADLLSKKYWRYFREGTGILESAGYSVIGAPFNFAAFGLPQERFRTVVLASRYERSLPVPPLGPAAFRTVRDAIGHLPPLAAGEKNEDDPMHWVSNHRKSTVDVLAQVPQDGGNRPIGVGPKCLDRARESHGGYTDVYGRLFWDKPAVTLTGKCRTPSAGRFTHPVQNRGLSIREAALLQGFPSDFVFEGNFDDRFQQIGNAVPPVVAKAFANHIATRLLVESQRRETDQLITEGIDSPVGKGFAIKINGIKRMRSASPSEAPYRKPTVVDLFCGAGGLSLGLQWAGFEVVRAVDNDCRAIETYQRNLGDHGLCSDLLKLSPRSLLNATKLKKRELTLLAGGPPCQGFSVKGNLDPNDPRNLLLIKFIDFVEVFEPAYFLIENVKGLLSKRGRPHFDKLQERAIRAGYSITTKTLHAVDYGVPQLRSRVFMIGERLDMKGSFSFPEPMLSADQYLTVRQALDGLPSPPQDGSPHPEFFNHFRESRLSKANQERIRAIPEGGGREDLPEHLQLPCHSRKDKLRHVDTYGRLSFDAPAVTITARFDSFTRGRFGHPVEHRSITLREGARLQSFPDAYAFAGNRGEAAKQIGNAVPPRLAMAIGNALLKSFASSPSSISEPTSRVQLHLSI